MIGTPGKARMERKHLQKKPDRANPVIQEALGDASGCCKFLPSCK
jgi:hypothetical protein